MFLIADSPLQPQHKHLFITLGQKKPVTLYCVTSPGNEWTRVCSTQIGTLVTNEPNDSAYITEVIGIAYSSKADPKAAASLSRLPQHGGWLTNPSSWGFLSNLPMAPLRVSSPIIATPFKTLEMALLSLVRFRIFSSQSQETPSSPKEGMFHW